MKNLDYLFILICTFLARIIIFGAGFSEALVFIACISYILLNKQLDQKKIIQYNESVDDKINKLEEEQKRLSASASAVQVGNTYSSIKR